MVLFPGFLEPGDAHSCSFFIFLCIFYIGVPLGPLQGQGSHWGSQGMGFPLGRSWSGPRGPLALWDPPRNPGPLGPPCLGFPLGRSWVWFRFHKETAGSGSNRFGSDRFPVNRSPVSGSGLGSRVSCNDPWTPWHSNDSMETIGLNPESLGVKSLDFIEHGA